MAANPQTLQRVRQWAATIHILLVFRHRRVTPKMVIKMLIGRDLASHSSVTDAHTLARVNTGWQATGRLMSNFTRRRGGYSEWF